MYCGSKKSLDDNLFHMARYIVKGANKLIDGRISFEYKASFNQSDLKLERELILGHRDIESNLYREKREEGLENPMAMTLREVLFQAIVVDGLMGSSKDRKGYLVRT